jgi:NDP-sugar pyrophosphorylase family protein
MSHILAAWPVALLAGGLATRLRPLTETVPKAMLPVAGKPFIDHQLRLLADQGIARVVICAGHLAEQIEDHVGDGRRFGLDVAYSVDGPTLLGTGGALRRALPLLSEAFLVLYGDSYLPAAIEPAVARFVAGGRAGLMTVLHNSNRWDTSNAEVGDGLVRRYDKRRPTPAMEYVDYGLGILRASVFADQPWATETRFDLADVYSALAAAGELLAHEVRERFYEIGSPTGLRDTEQYLLERQANAE